MSYWIWATQIYLELPLEMINSVIRAELPNTEDNVSLRERIVKYNMPHSNHLPYQTDCYYKDGKWIYGSPDHLQETTARAESERVVYRRRDEEDKIIVSYMPFRTHLLHCHVNDDMMFTVNICIYLYKYLYTPPDDTRYTVTNPNVQHTDQMKHSVNAWYVNASEAIW